MLVGGDCVKENFERREPNLCLWFARSFVRGEGLIRTIEWRPLTSLHEPPRFRHSVCVLNNTLYILGGRKYYGALDILKSALRWDFVDCLVFVLFKCRLALIKAHIGDHWFQFIFQITAYNPYKYIKWRQSWTWIQPHPLDLKSHDHLLFLRLTSKVQMWLLVMFLLKGQRKELVTGR